MGRDLKPMQSNKLNILAIISSFNEEDVIYHVIKDLIENGIYVYLIDNCSTDGTVAEAKKLLGKGLLHIETFPEENDPVARGKKEYLWHLILRRKEQITLQSDADWIIHADADEFRESPFPGTSLSEGITFVDRLGYNAINFGLYNFRPVDNSFVPFDDVRKYLTHFEPGRWFDHNQIKAWKNTKQKIDLVTSGGHSVGFEDRKIFPIPFLLRHYPIRSEQHGLRKVMQERAARFAQEEKAVGWHVQYDEFIKGERSYLWNIDELKLYNPHEIRENLLAQAFRRFLLLGTHKSEMILTHEHILSLAPGNIEVLQSLRGIFESFADMQSVEMVNSRIKDVMDSQKNKIPDLIPIHHHSHTSTDGKSLQVSIIIPVFNKFEYTRVCIETLYKFTPANLFEVFIVDNGSTDGTDIALLEYEKKIPNLHYIKSATNLGFAKANNLAARQANAKYILCLNNDTEFIQPWLEPMLQMIEDDPSIAAVAPKLLFPDRTIQHAGVVVIEDQRIEQSLVARHVHYGSIDNFPEATIPKTYPVLTAACLLICKEDFVAVGGFDELYWNGYEDVDLCFKLTGMNKQLVFQPASVLIHHESKSGTERFAKATENERLLNSRWKDKVVPNFTVDKDGTVTQTGKPIMPYIRVATPLTSIVIPVYNNLEYTKQCITSLEASTDLKYEVVIVNNASTDGTGDYLQTLAANSTKYVIINNKENVGFPGAVNQGLKASSGDYLVVANNDLLFTKHWLARLLELLRSNPQYGISAPMSNFVSGVQLDKEAKYTTVEEMYSYAESQKQKEAGNFFVFPRVAFLCVLFKRELLTTVGGLDERFAPGNFEDDDYCLRAQMAGYTTVVAKDVFIHHYGSKSFLADGEKKYLDRLEKNKNIFVKKWGFDPNEIWLQGKTPNKRNVLIPLEHNRYRELADRLQINISDNDYETAKLEVQMILNLANDPQYAVSDVERDSFQKLFEKLCIITGDAVVQEAGKQ